MLWFSDLQVEFLLHCGLQGADAGDISAAILLVMKCRCDEFGETKLFIMEGTARPGQSGFRAVNSVNVSAGRGGFLPGGVWSDPGFDYGMKT